MSSAGTDIRMKQSVRETISVLIHQALADGKSISLWRLPAEDNTHLLIADTVRTVDASFSLEESSPGFLVSPFDPSSPKFFLPADALFTVRKDTVEQVAGHAQPTSTAPSTRTLSAKSFHKSVSVAAHNSTRDDYEAFVGRCLNAIEQGVFEKVVPSRRNEIPLPDDADLINVFENLCARYTQAFVSLTSSAAYGTWIGASPELLVHVDKNMVFRTSALASTQAYKDGKDLKSVTWNQKEIEEQALVERYIISCFKKIRLREFDEHGPRTIRAGNLLHLKTDFSVDMRATNFPQLGTVMLQLLHPTSAVCGMPLEPALEFLRENEKHERQLYSGFLGPVNVGAETHIYVNLRCMQVLGETAMLYAGAGVTIDSTPSLEWEETVMKMNTLQQVVMS